MGGTEKIEKYTRYAQSRRILDKIIEKYDLDDLYDSEFREDTYKSILTDLDLTDNGDETFHISFEHEDRQLAAKIVYDLFLNIKNLDIEMSNKKATEFRTFLEARTNEASLILRIAEDSLKHYSELSGIVEVSEQIKQSIKLLSDLESEKIEMEIQRDFLRRNVYNNQGMLQQIEGKISVLNQKINDVYNTENYSNIAINMIPEKSLRYLRLYRNVKVQELILEFMIPQLENAKIEEKKNYSSLLLIDHPVPAERKTQS